MEIKKSPKVDLRKNSGLYFVIGLALVLFISWRAIEWKTFEKNYDYETLTVEDEEDEVIPITEQIKTPPPPPPPPPPAPQVIEIVQDEEDVEETVIESTETNEEEIVEIVDVEVEEEEEDVPFQSLNMCLFFQAAKVSKNQNAEIAFRNKLINTFTKTSATPKSLRRWEFKVGCTLVLSSLKTEALPT